MSLVEALRAVVWPFLILTLCLMFRGPLSDLIRPNRDQAMTVKFGPTGVEISRAAAAAAAAAAVTAANTAQGTAVDQKTLAANLAQGIEASLTKRNQTDNHRKLLWVDDNPNNNEYLVKAFGDLGIEVVVSKSTDDAEKQISDGHFDLIISDMSRPPDSEAGLTLIKFLKQSGNQTPVIIYAAKWAAEHRGQESAVGATLITNDPSKVYSTVLKRLLNPNMAESTP